MFDYTIKADATQALEASRKVEQSLERVTEANKNLGDEFAKQARRIADEQGRALLSAQKRASELDSRLSSMRGFEVLSQAFAHQADVLERLRAPYRDHQADVQALIGLYKRGEISAREYTGEIERMNRAVGMAPGGGAQPGLGRQIASGVAQGAGVSAIGVGGAAGIAAGLTGKAIGTLGEIGEMSDAYANLDNRLRRLTKDEDERATLMSRTKDIANATRSEWAATGELFVRLSNSTKDMNLGTERTLRLTETISKAFAMSGASSAEAAGGMLQLSQAFASGKLQGDEFKSLAESVPDVLDVIAKHMGVSRGALKDLASEGKITSQVLLESLEDAQSSIDEGFGKTAPTLSQQWTVFKNEMTEVFGKLVRDSDILPNMAAGLKEVVDGIGALANAYQSLKNIGGSGPLSEVAKSPGLLGAARNMQNEEDLRKLVTGNSAEDMTTAEKVFGDPQNWGKSWQEIVIARMTSTEAQVIAVANTTAQEMKKLSASVDAGAPSRDDLKDWITSGLNATSLITSTHSISDGLAAVDHVTQSLYHTFQVLGGTALDLGNLLGTSTESALGDLANALLDVEAAVSPTSFALQHDTATIDDWLVAVDQVPEKLSKVATGLTGLVNSFDVGKKLADLGKLLKDPWKDDKSITAHHPLSLMEKLYREIKEPLEQYTKGIAALDTLLRAHRITVDEYNGALGRLAATAGGLAPILEELHKGLRKDIRAAGGAQGGIVQGPGGTEETDAEFTHRFELEEKLAEEQAQADANRQGDLEKDLATKDKATAATIKWHDELIKISDEKGPIKGIKDGMESAYKSMVDVAGPTQKLLEDAFTGMEDRLVDAAMTGKFAWGDFVNTLEKDLMRLAIRIIEMRILTFLLGSGTWASFGSTGAGALPGISGGGLFGGGHANGGSWTAPMTGGGPDSIPVTFRVNPGERVDFTPRGGAPEASPSGGVRVVNNYDRHALLDEVDSPEGTRVVYNNMASAKRFGGRRRS